MGPRAQGRAHLLKGVAMSKSKVFLIAAVTALLLVVINVSGADKKFTDYTALIQSQWATTDVIAIVDISANATKKTTIADFDERYFNVSSDLLGVDHGGTGLTSGTSGGVLAFTASGTIASSGALLANQLLIGGGTGAAPSYLPAGSQYQVLRMGASSPAYGSIDLSQSAAVTGVLANANTTAASANTASAIVARDASGNFVAGTISAAISGNATTATSLFANPSDCAADTYATTIAASGNLTCATVTNAGLAGSIAASKLVGSDIATVGTVTTGTWSATTIALNKGGTGQTTKAAAFDALSPMSASGDIIYGGASGTGTRLAKGSDGNVLTLASGVPTWAAPTGGSAGAVTSKTSNYTATSSDGTIIVDPTSGNFTITLPAAASNTGLVYHIQKKVAANLVVIDPNSSETVCGQATIELVRNQDAVDIQSDGTNWIGLGESCYQTCSEMASSAGALSNADGCMSGNPTKSTGLYTYGWKGGTFSAILNCVANTYGATSVNGTVDSISAGSARVVTTLGSSFTLTDLDHGITCRGFR